MTPSPENKPKPKLSAAERALGIQLVAAVPDIVVGEEVTSSGVDCQNAAPAFHPPPLPVTPNRVCESSNPAYKTSSESSCLPAPGERFGDWYQLLEQLSCNTTTVTYKAVDISSDEFVSIKVLLPYFIEKTQSEQLVQHRIAQAQSLVHESIVPIKAIGTTDEGHTYIVEEFHDSITLKELMERARCMATKTAADVFVQICDGLEYAHSRGVVHGSLKPDDIVLFPNQTGGYQARIRNFAVDALIPTRDEDVQRLTGCGILLGSDLAQYLSSEQCVGNAPDSRSDIFALGCIMYEAISGRKAIESDSFVQALAQQIKEMPPSFADICFERQIPEAFEAVIFKCLQKRPEDRYQKASQLRLALMLPQVLNGKPKSRVATTDVAKHLDHDTSQMHKIAAISACVVAAGLIIATIFVWMPNHVGMPGDPAFIGTANLANPDTDTSRPPVDTAPGEQPADESSFGPLHDKLTASVAELTKTLDKNPSDVNALLARAQAYFDLYQYDSAVADLNTRRKVQAENWNGDADAHAAVRLRLQTLARDGQLSEALKLADQIVKLKPSDAEALRLRAGLLAKLGIGGEALSDATRAVNQEPRNAEGYLVRSLAYTAAGKPDLGVDDATKAEELAPDNIQVYGANIAALNALGKYAEAEAVCWKAFELSQESPDAYVWLGDAYAGQRRYVDAVFEYNQAIGIDGSLASGYLGVAKVSLKLAKYDEAIREASKAARLGNKFGAYGVMSQAYKFMGDSAKSTQYSKMAAEQIKPRR